MTELKIDTPGFFIYTVDTKGKMELEGQGYIPNAAAEKFWKITNNVSAKTGITRYVMVMDHRGNSVMAWRYGKGYTFDGKTYLDKPIFPKETRDYGKAKSKTEGRAG